jgi:hypothetical protein
MPKKRCSDLAFIGVGHRRNWLNLCPVSFYTVLIYQEA